MQVTQVTQQGKVQNKAKGYHIWDTWQAKHNMKYSMLYCCLIKYATDSHIYLSDKICYDCILVQNNKSNNTIEHQMIF